MANTWMVRSEGGELIPQFLEGEVSIGWCEVGDLARLGSPEAIRTALRSRQPEASQGATANSVAMLHKFAAVINVGDHVVTYDPKQRQYWLGEVTGPYAFRSERRDFCHVRPVRWTPTPVKRDGLRVSSRNSLGSTLTLFSISPDVWADLQSTLSGSSATQPELLADEERIELSETREDTQERAHELIKDRLLKLDDAQMEHLAAALLRAMGYRTRVTPKGPDRGVDVIASPDGLGFQEPRIKVEVKHRKSTSMGSAEVRGFLGGLRPGDRGLYLSTGGFSKEAKYEAERANMPVTLLDLDDLATLVVSHYDQFDAEGRALITLVKVYWPSE
jgi:restriction system protein